MTVYVDDQQAGVNVTNNKFVDCDKDVYVGGGRDNFTAYNTFNRTRYQSHSLLRYRLITVPFSLYYRLITIHSFLHYRLITVRFI